MTENLCDGPLTRQARPLAAHAVDQGGAWTRSGARPQCARFLYGLAFGLSRSLAIPSSRMAHGDRAREGAASMGADCPASCPPADGCGQAQTMLGADLDW